MIIFLIANEKPKVLRFAKIKILPTTACPECRRCPKPEYLCGQGYGKQRTEKGDSGSALVYNDPKKGNVIIGVDAAGYWVQNHTEKITAFTKVTHFLDWIGKETGIKA